MRIQTSPSRICAQKRNRGRTDAAIARQLGIGGKDLYRQARAVWRLARSGDVRAQSGITQLDAGIKTIHAAYKTCAAVIASVPIFARHPTMSGPSGTTGPLASPTRVRSRRRSSHMLFTTTRSPTPSSSTLWLAAAPRSTFANRWGAAASPTTFTRPDRMSVPMTYAMAFPSRRLADLISVTPLITRC